MAVFCQCLWELCTIAQETSTHGAQKDCQMQVLILHFEKNVKKNAINCCLFRHKMREAIWLALPTFWQWSRNVCNSFWSPTHSLARETTIVRRVWRGCPFSKAYEEVRKSHTLTLGQLSCYRGQSLDPRLELWLSAFFRFLWPMTK